jgi:molybdopterin-binding protein
MPGHAYSAAEAARLLGISLDTLRRWDRSGKLRTSRDPGGRRIVDAAEIERLGGGEHHELSARNRFRGTVASVRIDGLLAQVEIDVTEPARLVALITADAAAELALKPGDPATGIVKATSVMVER